MSYGYGYGYRIGTSQRGPTGPQLVISASSVLESALPGSTVGVLSVVGGSGTYTFTKTADPDSKFAVSGANLNLAAGLNFEDAQSHNVTISASNGVDAPIVRVFTISVVNVNEQPALGVLGGTFTLAENSAQGTSAGSLTGRTAGSTLTMIDNAGGRVQLSGTTIQAGPTSTDFEAATTHSFTVRETLADSPNSPRDTTLTLTVTQSGGVTILTREANGTVTVQSLGPTFTPVLTRQPNGTVEVS